MGIHFNMLQVVFQDRHRWKKVNQLKTINIFDSLQTEIVFKKIFNETYVDK